MQNSVEEYLSRLIRRDKNLLISISGVRGTIPEGLDPEIITHFAMAFAFISGKKIVIGNDSRTTGPAIKQIFMGTLIANGKEIIDVGLAPTPVIKAAVNYFKADAGVIVSASHNPMNWNGFKFLGKNGFFFSKPESDKMIDALLQARRSSQDYKNFGVLKKMDANDLHIKAILKKIPNKKEIIKQNYKVVVDAVDGAGRDALPLLLEELGCSVSKLYCSSSKNFPRPPEPVPAALKKFGGLVQSQNASIGFAMDPDADRLVCASPALGCINEEYTLPLAYLGLAHIIGNKKSIFVVNLSTAELLDRVCENLGHKVVRSPVGEANVVKMMKQNKSMFGGEGNGGVIWADIPSFGRDTLSGAALILSAMAARKAQNLDELMKDMPRLFMKKTKMDLGPKQSVEQVYDKMKKIFGDAELDIRDGLHLKFRPKSTWLHIRPSNTEPVVRMIAEAQSQKELKGLLDRAQKAFI